MSTKWVALHGPAGSGKDSIAKILVDRYGWTRIAFADPVREMALAIDPWIDTNVHEWQMDRLSNIVRHEGWEVAKRDFPEVRRILQRIGTDAVRAQSPDYWVDLAQTKAEACDGSVVFTDTRFQNEAYMVFDHHGLVVKIESEVQLDGENATHASETALANWDFDLVFKNPRTLNQKEIDQRMAHFAMILADEQQSE